MELELGGWPLLADLLVDNAEGEISLFLAPRHQLERLFLRSRSLSVHGAAAAVQTLRQVKLAELRAGRLAAGTPEALRSVSMHCPSVGCYRRGWDAAAIRDFDT